MMGINPAKSNKKQPGPRVSAVRWKMSCQEGSCKATWKREIKLPERERGRGVERYGERERERARERESTWLRLIAKRCRVLMESTWSGVGC